MLGRRRFLGTVGVTAVALVAARAAGRLGRRGTTASAAALEDGTREGTAIASEERPVDVQLSNAGVKPKARFHTCEVQSLERTEDGAVSVRLADSAGQLFEVEVLGHDSRAPGVARAGSLSVYMKNKGNGSTATVEEHGLAAMAVARHLAARELTGTKLPVLPRLSDRNVGV